MNEAEREFSNIKNLPFPDATHAGLVNLEMDMNEARRRISPRKLLGWFAWRYCRDVQNPFLDPTDRNNSILIQENGTYVVDNKDASKLARTLPTTGFEGYFVGYENEKSPAELAERTVYNSFSRETEHIKPSSNRQLVANAILGVTDENYLDVIGFPAKFTSEGVAKSIGILGAMMLESIRTSYRNSDSRIVNRFFTMLTTNQVGTLDNAHAFRELNALMGLAVGKLKTLVPENKDSTAWQAGTHAAVASYIGSAAYETANDGNIQEKFNLPEPLNRALPASDKKPTWNDLPTSMNIAVKREGSMYKLDNTSPKQLNIREGYMFMALLGKMGHPLINIALAGV